MMFEEGRAFREEKKEEKREEDGQCSGKGRADGKHRLPTNSRAAQPRSVARTSR
jgi:hypothetical protein